MTEDQRKVKTFIIKITLKWKLQDLHEFGEQHNNQISKVKFDKNNTKTQVHRYTHSLLRLIHPN